MMAATFLGMGAIFTAVMTGLPSNASSNGTNHVIAGTLFDGKLPKIVQIDQYRVDFTPEGYLLLVPHIDQPNMIGQMATILGKANINIGALT